MMLGWILASCPVEAEKDRIAAVDVPVCEMPGAVACAIVFDDELDEFVGQW